MILWGPPGVGKTTLARLMADAFNAEFIALSAVLSGVKDIRDAVARAEATLAQSGRATILFVDEVHRFNKAQQDAFLPYVEQGLVTFIGATTENPSFEVNGALLSRAAVYVLEPLSADELGAAARSRGRARRRRGMSLDAAGARRADRLRRRRRPPAHQPRRAARGRRGRGRAQRPIDLAFVEATIARSLRRFDKGGEAFYDQISALHKAVRGSRSRRGAVLDVPDARRRRRSALRRPAPDPHGDRGHRPRRSARAARSRSTRSETYERLGSPEGELALAECVLYLAVRAEVERRLHRLQRGARVHRARTARGPCRCACATRRRKLMKDLGYGKGYRYAHDEEDAYAAGETLLSRRHAAT